MIQLTGIIFGEIQMYTQKNALSLTVEGKRFFHENLLLCNGVLGTYAAIGIVQKSVQYKQWSLLRGST